MILTAEKNENRVFDVGVIGGGAAGLSAAIAAARMGADVILLEADSRVGRKILASGNGRCNLTNLSVSPTAYNRPDFVAPVLSAYPYEAISDFFGSMGLLSVADDEGRVYPVTNAAGSVLDVVRMECARLGVDVRCDFEVTGISRAPGTGGFEVSSRSGMTVHARTVVVTTGGGGSLLAALGHGMEPTVPVLGPIRTETESIRGLSGVRVKCAAMLLAGVGDDSTASAVLATERGELLFRDYGVSGIMIFDLSRYLESDCVLSIDLFPDVAASELETIIARRCADFSWRTPETLFVGMLHDRVARAVLRAAGIAVGTPLSTLSHRRLATALKEFRLRVIGMGEATQAQVTRGGACVDQFDALASRLVHGLFAAGEVLDIDGRSGGFNLHWAWASGIVAGEAAARSVCARTGEQHSDQGSAGLAC